MLDLRTKQKIEKQIASDRVFLYMKGTPLEPMCGFSNGVIRMLNELDTQYKTFNVLSDMDIRNGIKEYAEWPTIPQLYVNGKFVGGHDVLREMFDSGELQQLLNLEK